MNVHHTYDAPVLQSQLRDTVVPSQATTSYTITGELPLLLDNQLVSSCLRLPVCYCKL